MVKAIKKILILGAVLSLTFLGFPELAPTVLGFTFGGLTLATVLVGLGEISKLLAPSLSSINEQRGLTEEIKSPIAPRTLVYGERRIAGAMLYAGSHGIDNKFISFVFHVASHEIDSFQRWYVDDIEVFKDSFGFVTTAPYTDKIRITSHLGTATQPADTDLVSDITEWTTAHQLKGLAYYAVRFEFDQEVFPSGRPKITTVIRGATVFDTRTSSTAWSQNTALILRDYLIRDPLGGRIPVADIDDSLVNTAANICDELVSLKVGGTQIRYTADGGVTTRNVRESIIRDIMSSMAGKLVFQSGKFKMYAGSAIDVINLSFDEDALRGSITVKTKLPRSQLVNRVRGTYIDARNDLFQPADYPQVINTTFEAEDNNEILEFNLDLPFTTDAIRAQRIGKIFLGEARRQFNISLPLNLRGLPMQAWGVVKISNSRWEWVDEQFRVLSWEFSEDGGIDANLQDYDASIYSWIPATDEGTPLIAASPTLDDGFTVPAVTGLLVTATALEKDGTKIPALVVTWDVPSKVADHSELQFKLNSGSNWNPTSNIFDISNPRVEIIGVLPGESYDVRVRHVSNFGVSGPWIQITATALAIDSFVLGSAVLVGGTGALVIEARAQKNAPLLLWKLNESATTGTVDNHMIRFFGANADGNPDVTVQAEILKADGTIFLVGGDATDAESTLQTPLSTNVCGFVVVETDGSKPFTHGFGPDRHFALARQKNGVWQYLRRDVA